MVFVIKNEQIKNNKTNYLFRKTEFRFTWVNQPNFWPEFDELMK